MGAEAASGNTIRGEKCDKNWHKMTGLTHTKWNASHATAIAALKTESSYEVFFSDVTDVYWSFFIWCCDVSTSDSNGLFIFLQCQWPDTLWTLWTLWTGSIHRVLTTFRGVKGSMPPCIGHMELLAWMQRADFSEHIQRFKPHGTP